MALISGVTGFEALDLIIREAPAHLESGGWLVLEHGWKQAEAVRQRLVSQGFVHVRSHADLAGHERVTEGQWPGPVDHLEDLTMLEFKTSKGTFTVQLFDKQAPISVENFLRYADEGFFDGTIFHRVIPGFMIQGGGLTAGHGATRRVTTRSRTKPPTA